MTCGSRKSASHAPPRGLFVVRHCGKNFMSSQLNMWTSFWTCTVGNWALPFFFFFFLFLKAQGVACVQVIKPACTAQIGSFINGCLRATFNVIHTVVKGLHSLPRKDRNLRGDCTKLWCWILCWLYINCELGTLLCCCQQIAKENSTLHLKQTFACNYVSEANANVRDL